MQTYEPVQITGLTREDIVKIFEQLKKQIKGSNNVVWMDSSYLYQFAPDDVYSVTKMSQLARYDFKYAIEWHRRLERWMSDQTVRDYRGVEIKPMAIQRSIDKVPNEGLRLLTQGFVGASGDSFNWHGLGKGVDLTQAFASDVIMVDEIERIDVWATPGGSLSTDGITVIGVGNHDINMPGAGEPITEQALFNVEDPAFDLMGDHSIFPTGIPHSQGQDAMGGTIVIFNCSV